jgi:hypothetical protein
MRLHIFLTVVSVIYFFAISALEPSLSCRQDPDVQYELEEIKAVIAFDREVAGSVGPLSLIKIPGNPCLNCCLLSVVLGCFNVGSNAFSLNTILTLTYSAYCDLASLTNGVNAHGGLTDLNNVLIAFGVVLIYSNQVIIPA